MELTQPLRPPTAAELLTRTLARDGAQTSATSTQRQLHDPAGRLADEVDRYRDSLTVAAAKAFRHDARTTRRDRPEDDTTARGAGPLPWLPPIPAALATHPVWGSYLADRAQHVHDLAQQTAEAALGWTAGTCPAWATPLLNTAHQDDGRLVTRLAVWRAAHRVPDDDLRPTGAPLPHGARAQQSLDEAVHRLLPHGPGTASRCADLAAVEPRLTTDPGYAQLVARLNALPETADVRALALQALARGPLPDELPAAALWWRVTRNLPDGAGPPQTPVTSPPATTVTAADRWKPLADSSDPRLSACPAWRGLASALDRAEQAGYDVATHLPRLADQVPLPDSYPTRSLHYRLIDECHVALTPPPKGN